MSDESDKSASDKSASDNGASDKTASDNGGGDGLVKMSILDHLTELRNRIAIIMIAFVVIFIACFVRPFGSDTMNAADWAYFMLQAPLADLMLEHGGRMIFTALQEAFITQVKVAFFIAISITFPFILLQVWRFVAPALYGDEKGAFLPFLIATPVLFVMGGSMVYFVVAPLAFEFFLSFQMSGIEGALPIEVEPRISEYLSLMMRLMFAFGVAFELPVILLLLVKAGFLTAKIMASQRKYAILIAFIAAAILTPPDVISQVLLALPVIILYELSIIAARFMTKRDDKDEDSWSSSDDV